MYCLKYQTALTTWILPPNVLIPIFVHLAFLCVFHGKKKKSNCMYFRGLSSVIIKVFDFINYSVFSHYLAPQSVFFFLS